MGWGQTPWGGGQWGVGGAAALQLLMALAVRENVVRLWFNEAPVFTKVLDPHDGSAPARYVVSPVAGTMPDGTDPRAVTAIIIEQVAEPMALGRIIDVTVDRHFDGYPGRYLVACNQLVSADTGAWLDPLMFSASFDGAVQLVDPLAADLAHPVRDIANPQTLSGLLDPLPSTSIGTLGSIPVNVNGDYAFDEGFTSYYKRVLRRITSRKNRFAHLPGYGTIMLENVKHVGKASVRASIAADIKTQVKEEPETIDASCVIVPDPNAPGLYRIRLRVNCTLSNKPVNIDEPFAVNG